MAAASANPEPAAAEHGQFTAAGMSGEALVALGSFLSLGLKHFWAGSTEKKQNWAVFAALMDPATMPGEPYSLSADECDALVKLWNRVAFQAPEKVQRSQMNQRPLVWKIAKDPDNFIIWARRCQQHRCAVSAAEQGVPGSLPSWQGGVELSEAQNTACYKLTVKHIIDHELTPRQRRDPACCWTESEDRGPSKRLRSLHDAIVHNHLGDKRVAMHLYQHGLPRLLCKVDAPPSSPNSATAAEHRRQGAPSEDTIQAALAEAIHWLASLATTLSARQTDVHMPVLRLLSARLDDLSPEQREERRARIASFRQVVDQIATAKRLVQERDSRKRHFVDMCARDQQLLEAFETGILQKRRTSCQVPRGAAFRSQLASASAAAEHAAASSTASAKLSLSSNGDDD